MKGTIVGSGFCCVYVTSSERNCFPLFVCSIETDETLDLGGVYVPCIYSHAR